jgi:hypothetical protein
VLWEIEGIGSVHTCIGALVKVLIGRVVTGRKKNEKKNKLHAYDGTAKESNLKNTK